MTTAVPNPVSKVARWTGGFLGAVACLMMLFSGSIKFVQPAGIPEHFSHLGWAMNTVWWLGVLELACTVLYLAPRTAVFGAILLTAYLGGAAAAHVRVGEGGIAWFPIGLGLVLWTGLYLREPRLRALLPTRLPSGPRC